MKTAVALFTAMFLCSIAPCANAGTSLGKVCFKLTNFPDIFVWDVELVGGSSFTVTGTNTTNLSAMFGGGGIVGNKLKLTVTESGNGAAVYNGIHSITIDLGTLAGIDDIQFHKQDNSNIWLKGQPFTPVTCP
jgi:hypothetical protein